MILRELLAGVPLTGGNLDLDMEISSISYDTRTLAPGALFVALSGDKTDGHLYIQTALEKGASAVLCERAPEESGPWLTTPDSRCALALVSANWFGRPGDGMTLVAVTGTNGKTTTTSLLKELLEQVTGARVGLVGTNRNMIGGVELPAHRTTPESYELQSLLRRMADWCKFGDVIVTTPARHDEMIAYTSQLMHVIALSVCDNDELFACQGFEGGSFRDCTRVAALDPAMWVQLFSLNAPALTQVVRTLEGRMRQYRQAMEAGDKEALRDMLARASDRKKRINLERARGDDVRPSF